VVGGGVVVCDTTLFSTQSWNCMEDLSEDAAVE